VLDSFSRTRTPGDDLEAEVEEVAEDALQSRRFGAPTSGLSRRHQAGQVHAEVRLQGVCL